MGKLVHDKAAVAHAGPRGGHALDWRKKMSDNVALALIVYTGLQIFVTVHALKKGFPSMFAYVALIVLVAGIIPACRWFERRWLHIGDTAAADHGLVGAFRRDQAMLWILAIGLPFLVTGLLKAMFSGA